VEDDKGSKPKKNISGLSFRYLKQEDQTDHSQSFLFVNEEISDKTVFHNINQKLVAFIHNQEQTRNILSFFIDLTQYLYSRIRVIAILLSVLLDLLSDLVDIFKDKVVKKMFWGRGNFLGSALQSVVFIIVFILVISYVYRRPVVIEASDNRLSSVGVPETDTMVVNATLNTLIPKDRARFSIEEYTVKRGDTVSTIASAYGISSQTLLWANDMSATDYLKIGQVLQIPPKDGVVIKIAKGDTVESLAKKYSADAADIVDFNQLEKPYTLTVGSTVFIPNGEMPVVAVKTSTSTPSSYQSTIGYSQTTADPNVGRFLGWPLAGPSAISRGFGGGHYGIDIYPVGGQWNVVAACSGVIISSGWGYNGTMYGGYGNYTHIDCQNGYTVLNAHMARLYVSTGQYVTKGQALGLVGDTGVAYGIHTHLELRRGASLSGRIDPAPYMSTMKYIP
jgi:murein DD-endopeptidase MepM/ murein hydrolase activator NlpD